MTCGSMILHSESLWGIRELSNCSSFLSVEGDREWLEGRKKKKPGFVLLTPRAAPAEEIERFSGLDLTGLLILGASERPQRAF